MPNGGSARGGQYYTTKGQGSQESYDAYFEDYGTSAVWSGVNVDTQSNIGTVHHGGSIPFVTTSDSIEKRLVEPKGVDLKLIIGGIIAFLFLR